MLNLSTNIFKLQCINPGMVDTDFLKCYQSKATDMLPKLKADDVANAVIYALNTPDYVQVGRIFFFKVIFMNSFF